MSDTKVGILIGETAVRDAIHIAVAPVFSSETLHPGQHIGLIPGSTSEVGSLPKPIGIVDPFLGVEVKPGQKFWLFLYPQTVTGMKHHWRHPAFNTASEAQEDAKSESEKWLRAYASDVNSYDEPEEAYQRLIKGLKSGELAFHGTDLHSFSDLDDADELREHAERVLGIRVGWEHFTFSCSC